MSTQTAAHCDNKSVGILIRDDAHRFLLIERENYPISLACVAGHVDGDSYEDAARKEAHEEAGLTLGDITLRFERTLHNPCRRDGGHGHHWKIFEALSWSGTPQAGSDAGRVFWATHDELCALARKTRALAEKKGVVLEQLERSTPVLVGSPEWKKEASLEPVWVVILEAIGII